jgi:fatty acid desaturase
MGHEASHRLLVRNRRWNDLLADWLVFFPLLSTLPLYRAKHLGHHLHPNDPVLDPNLHGGRAARLYARFPLARREFVRTYFVKFLWPPFALQNLLDYAAVLDATRDGNPAAARGARILKRLGITYCAALLVLLRVAREQGWPLLPCLGAMTAAGVIGWLCVPSAWFAVPVAPAFSPRWGALGRLLFFTLLFGALAAAGRHWRFDPGPWFLLLWVLPLFYTFPQWMLLREIYQHANAGTGDLDNSRIMRAGPFTRWALLGYGNAHHQVHHLWPTLPHDRLAEVHETLRRESAEYRGGVQETSGVLRSAGGNPSLLDALSQPPHRAPALESR